MARSRSNQWPASLCSCDRVVYALVFAALLLLNLCVRAARNCMPPHYGDQFIKNAECKKKGVRRASERQRTHSKLDGCSGRGDTTSAAAMVYQNVH